MKKGYLVLQDGQIFEGIRFGADTSSIGELVFTTGMTGYVETLTDPSYAGQMILQTYPLIGNVGMIPSDYEGNCVVRGYIVREWCDKPSNFRAGQTLDAFLRERNIPGLCGLDTRRITRIIREHGVMNAAICDAPPSGPDAARAMLDDIRAYTITGAVDAVTCREISEHPADMPARFRVAVIDYGSKHNIVRELNQRACDVTVFPAFTSAAEILSRSPDGVMLSNGPGDPADNPGPIEQLRQILGKVPLFGICLGHQLTALALGGRTFKMKYGHHGANQPVKEILSEPRPDAVRYPVAIRPDTGNAVYPGTGNAVQPGTGNAVRPGTGNASRPGMDHPAANADAVFYPPAPDPVTGGWIAHDGPARTYITSQNHGYAVDMDSLPVGRLSFANANDGTCEGVDYPELAAFTVQFHPEAHGGPMDTAFLFDRFIRLMEEHSKKKGSV